ncbi:MAG TPA: hypothetical protein V6D30_04530 [Leptolyngbyaceae cyanobacterium]
MRSHCKRPDASIAIAKFTFAGRCRAVQPECRISAIYNSLIISVKTFCDRSTSMEFVTTLKTTEVSRLFSNLALEGNRFNHQPGSLLGCTALVAETTVGA